MKLLKNISLIALLAILIALIILLTQQCGKTNALQADRDAMADSLANERIQAKKDRGVAQFEYANNLQAAQWRVGQAAHRADSLGQRLQSLSGRVKGFILDAQMARDMLPNDSMVTVSTRYIEAVDHMQDSCDELADQYAALWAIDSAKDQAFNQQIDLMGAAVQDGNDRLDACERRYGILDSIYRVTSRQGKVRGKILAGVASDYTPGLGIVKAEAGYLAPNGVMYKVGYGLSRLGPVYSGGLMKTISLRKKR